ncbi:MAG: periplasmic heavy metal sensor [Gemmatimonadales bacterium]
MKHASTMITILALSATPLLAQGHEQHGQQPRQGMGMMGQGGMQMGGGGDKPMGPLTGLFGGYAPAKVLEMKAHLSLTSQQEAALTALVEAEKAAVTAAHHPAHAAHMELRKLQGAESPDTAAMRPFFMAHHTAEGNMQWVRVSYAIQAKALLTPAQRSHVEQMGGGAGHP